MEYTRKNFEHSSSTNLRQKDQYVREKLSYDAEEPYIRLLFLRLFSVFSPQKDRKLCRTESDIKIIILLKYRTVEQNIHNYWIRDVFGK